MPNDPQYINSILRAISVMELLGAKGGEMGINEVSRQLDLQKTTAFRIIKTLEKSDWIIRNPQTGKYRIGYRVMHLIYGLGYNHSQEEIFLPELRALRDEFNEDVMLSIPSGASAICIEKLRSQNSLMIVSQVGRILPMHCGATGKVFLAYQKPEVLEQILSGKLERYTSETKTERALLERDVELIRKQGYVVSVGEIDEGVYGIGVPVFDQRGEVPYGISLCGAAERIESKGPEKIIGRMLEVSRRLSGQLNCLSRFEE